MLYTRSLLFAGCATSPEVEGQRQEIEAVIASILSEPLDPEIYGKTKRCLADQEYRNFRVLTTVDCSSKDGVTSFGSTRCACAARTCGTIACWW